MIARSVAAPVEMFTRYLDHPFVPVDPPLASFAPAGFQCAPPSSLSPIPRDFDTRRKQEDMVNLNCIRLLGLHNGPILSNLVSSHLAVNQDLIVRIIDSLPDTYQRLPYVSNWKKFQLLLTGLYGSKGEENQFSIEDFSPDNSLPLSLDSFSSAFRKGGKVLDVIFKRPDRFLELLIDSFLDRLRQISEEPALIFQFTREISTKIWKKFGIFLRNPNSIALPLPDLLAAYRDLFGCTHLDLQSEFTKMLQRMTSAYASTLANGASSSPSISSDDKELQSKKRQKGSRPTPTTTALTPPAPSTKTPPTSKPTLPPCMSYLSFLTGHGTIDCSLLPRKNCFRFSHLPIASANKAALKANATRFLGKDQNVLADILAKIG